jgi:hypothetical protein
VGPQSCANQILKIECHGRPVLEISLRNRIHVMHDQTRVNLSSGDTQITTLISNDGVSAKMTPLSRCIELLVDPTIVSERLAADLPLDSQVLVSILEGVVLNKFGVRSNQGTHRTRRLRLQELGQCISA